MKILYDTATFLLTLNLRNVGIKGGIWKLLDVLAEVKEAINVARKIFGSADIQGSFACGSVCD